MQRIITLFVWRRIAYAYEKLYCAMQDVYAQVDISNSYRMLNKLFGNNKCPKNDKTRHEMNARRNAGAIGPRASADAMLIEKMEKKRKQFTRATMFFQ